MDNMRLPMIRLHYASYAEARRILASNFISVAERKAAINIRDEFLSVAPSYVKELMCGLDLLRAYTEGEECADPDSCNLANGDPVWLCSRCRIREAIPEPQAV
jgi:hypothetical protein